MNPARLFSRIAFSLLLLSFAVDSSAAAKEEASEGSTISIMPSYGYFFAETFQTEYGKVRLNDGPVYGVSLSMRKSSWSEFELNWSHQVTRADANIYFYDGHNSIIQEFATGNIAIDYFTVGMNGVKEFNKRFSGYAGIGAGMVVFTPQNSNFEAQARFALAVKAGVRVSITDYLSIKIQPQLYSPIQSIGASVFVSSSGSGVGVTTYSTITQFGGIAGLSFSF